MASRRRDPAGQTSRGPLRAYGRPAFAAGALALAVFLAYDGFSVGMEPVVIAALALLGITALAWWLLDRR